MNYDDTFDQYSYNRFGDGNKNSGFNTVEKPQAQKTAPCLQLVSALWQSHYMTLGAIFLTALLTLLSARTRNKCSNTNRLPGLLVPLNAMNGGKHAFAQAAVIGCVMYDMVTSWLFNTAFTLIDPVNFGLAEDQWLSTFLTYAKVLSFAVLYYPISVSLEFGSENIWAPVIGLLYSLLLISMHLAVPFCRTGFRSDTYIKMVLFIMLPYLVSNGFICVTFIRNLMKISNSTGSKDKSGHPAALKCSTYVKTLLSKDSEQKDDLTPFQFKVLNRIDQRKTFSKTMLLKMCSQNIKLITFAVLFMGYIAIGNSIVAVWFGGNYTSSTVTGIFLLVSLLLAAICAFLVTLFNIYCLYIGHRHHVKRLLQGDHSFISDRCWNMRPDLILTRYTMFPSAMIGHVLMGYIAVFFFMAINGGILVLVISQLENISQSDNSSGYSSGFNPGGILKYTMIIFLPVTLKTILVRIAIWPLSKIFLQQEEYITEDGKTSSRHILALNIHRRGFHNLSYFVNLFFLINGVLSGIVRVFFLNLIGLFSLGRIDKCILPQGFEHFDYGYLAYVSSLKMILFHYNPVVITFCDLLTNKQPTTNTRSEDVEADLLQSMEQAVSFEGKSKLACRRWHKLYTLQRNPDLVHLTKFSLRQKQN